MRLFALTRTGEGPPCRTRRLPAAARPLPTIPLRALFTFAAEIDPQFRVISNPAEDAASTHESWELALK
jgi:hypothetical protein